MTLIILLTLGIIQGLTEFLPVSSSGHLVVLYQIFGIENDTIILSIIFHIATLIAILWWYRKDLIMLIKSPFCPTNRKILVTTIFTGLVVVILKPIIDITFSGTFISTFFMITAILLIISDIISEKHSFKNRIENIQTDSLIDLNICNLPITYRQAIIIGLGQGIACIPGISRSGTTISIAKFLRLENISAKYSFLISIPIIIGSLILEILEGHNLSSINGFYLSISCIVCFIIGLLCIKIVDKLSKTNRLSIFSYYLFLLSLFLIINSLWLHLF